VIFGPDLWVTFQLEKPIEKPMYDFSLKSRKDEVVARYDPKCKVCKRSERNRPLNICATPEQKHTSLDQKAQHKVGPTTHVKIPEGILVEVLGADTAGLNSTYAENFNEFIHILRSEYAKLIGVTCVYVKKTERSH
jgi:hypothetical protein